MPQIHLESQQTTLHQNALTTKRNDVSVAQILDHSKSALDIEPKDLNKKTEEDETPIFVETKYCTVCNLEQPLRTKHCSSCKRCVTTYDHHCPWIGNCVAEKNRKMFFIYIHMQLLISLIAFLISLYAEIKEEDVILKILFAPNCVISGFFTLMLTSLVIFHQYIVSKNLTTWECLSWKKISYMKIWPRKYGSPFD